MHDKTCLFHDICSSPLWSRPAALVHGSGFGYLNSTPVKWRPRLALLMMVPLRNLRRRRISTGQILLWTVLLTGGELLALFPGVIDSLSVLWENLIPVSWITFSGLAILSLYSRLCDVLDRHETITALDLCEALV